VTAKPTQPKRLLHFEFTTMDAALKMVESLVTQGAQCAIAPLERRRGFTVSAPDRVCYAPAPTEGVAA
jgi:hypothetical protein